MDVATFLNWFEAGGVAAIGIALFYMNRSQKRDREEMKEDIKEVNRKLDNHDKETEEIKKEVGDIKVNIAKVSTKLDERTGRRHKK